MAFDSLQAVWQMGGHGPFVRSAYAIALATLTGIVWAPLQRRRHFLRELAAGERRRELRSESDR
jgi:heme exporter protein D